MDDGMQYGFGFRPQSNSLLRRDEIVVDLFAGGGGASEALRQAIARANMRLASSLPNQDLAA